MLSKQKDALLHCEPAITLEEIVRESQFCKEPVNQESIKTAPTENNGNYLKQ